jgi:hypothetical protein
MTAAWWRLPFAPLLDAQIRQRGGRLAEVSEGLWASTAIRWRRQALRGVSLLEHGRSPGCVLYGDGEVSEAIA